VPLSNLDLVNSLNAVPMEKRLAILTLSIIESDPGATAPPRHLIATACLMAEQLNEEQRAVIAAYMRSVADLLEAERWN
jgi:hypothetical protein